MAGEQEADQRGRISARMVEEAYVNLQETMRTYRTARNQGPRAAGLAPDTNPVIVLQDAVETFYHLIRPFVAREPRLKEYWRGALAAHPDEHLERQQALEYYREHSVGVWQAQPHVRHIQGAQQGGANLAAVTDGGLPSPGEFHDRLNLSDSVRVLSVVNEGGALYYVEGRFAVLGLREIGDWEVRTRVERGSGDGFMSGETTSAEVREPEPAKKVETGAEMLVDVADKLNAIASYEPGGEPVHGTPVPDE